MIFCVKKSGARIINIIKKGLKKKERERERERERGRDGIEIDRQREREKGRNIEGGSKF